MALAGFSLILPVGSFTVKFTGFLGRGECDEEQMKCWFIARAALATAAHKHCQDSPTFSQLVVFQKCFFQILVCSGLK